MSLKLLEHISLAGDPAKPNEDSSAWLDHAALVLDGATPLGPPLLPGKSDAAWIAQFGARRLLAHLKDGEAPREALEHALFEAEKSFAGLARAAIREKWQTPCASLMLVAEPGPGRRGSKIEFLWFGDCSALVEQDGRVEVIGNGLRAREEEAERARQVAGQIERKSALGVERPEILPLLRAARNRINSGGNWLFSPDRRAAAHVSHRTIAAEKGARLLLASDGFLALVSDYRLYDPPGLMRAASAKGLKALGEELRAIENSDPRGERFFRFKASDDATALLLQRI